MKIVSIFNNKGGVGKTTYMYHIAHILARKNKVVLAVDLDSQCNLSAYAISESELEKSWKSERGNSIWNIVEPVYERIGDIKERGPSKINENLHIVPGDVLLSNFEDSLGDSWNSAKGGNAGDLRVQSAIYRYILWAANKVRANVVMLDLGPNLGALNRAVLSSSDYFIVPMSPDLFSIRGTQNLGSKLKIWRKEWEQCKKSYDENANKKELNIPKGKPIFLGYVMQQHNIRKNSSSNMTKGWSIFHDRVEGAVKENIIDKLEPLGQIYDWRDNNWNLGKIPNLHSLIPYSLEARKPVFDCGSKEGLMGAHITSAKNSIEHFEPIVDKLMHVLNGFSEG
uniref:CobQ/CobB/MinD/ParA nucleotide binding domain-containing protein n=1 Tax=Candidatus Kentrum sp. UNK TaxID=2126344 RepID=A0A451B381_9GAMM|nr:MAG: CobQ/CobB/MinD/ParA nucleotide binding domain-containing protein [Candidatus Kentron sp. UNK]VFK72735.1 MAG: CobQ/CobB/MinD/ParA nucleotide binding domain-containing protein [Candidatus Kentron sp. UNK]